MEQLIAYCGLDCGKCDAHIATANDDWDLRRKTASLWSELNGIVITPEQINCQGCRCDGVKTLYCERLCEIRKCAVSRDFGSCGLCPEADTCPKLHTVIGNNPIAADNLKKVKGE
ncbi:MAG: DUF3795 domain-containing protein [Eggerthellaceae bacterium]|nr:DUF3795 domain-containing protein [Eggerthellaceae bacterium]